MLVVLFGNRSGGYDLAVANHKLIPRRVNPNQDPPFNGVTIANGVLRVKMHEFLEAGGWRMGTNSFAFRWQDGTLRLIGYDRDAIIDLYRSSKRNRTFVLFDGNELAGMSSYLGIDPYRGSLEIGGTYYRPKFRGTGFNRRVKDMMLRRAFDCGIRRVEFRVDRRNARSQAAMKKVGAVREGVLRADRSTWTGHVRDTVRLAILKDEYEC